MGLDISYYKGIRKIDCLFNESGEAVDPRTREEIDYDTYFKACLNSHFPGRADDIEDRACYAFADADGFRAGGYGGFNVWRNELAKLAGYPEGEYEQYGRMWPSYCVACWNGEAGPFSELINFSDCEGVIGTAVSKKLAADFAKFQAKADAHPDDWFREKYADWRRAFEAAAEDGCVTFH